MSKLVDENNEQMYCFMPDYEIYFSGIRDELKQMWVLPSITRLHLEIGGGGYDYYFIFCNIHINNYKPSLSKCSVMLTS